MEILSPSFSNSYLGVRENVINITNWTQSENKVFEEALAVFDESTPERWLRVAEKLPGKTVADVVRRYQELEADISSIEAGLYPIPSYENSLSPFTLNSYGFGKKGFGRSDLERKKGVPWTEEEHKLFLLGLKKYGKGDWRNISRNFVVSRTPTQVASHAQKYFIRQLSGAKDKRRSSIHDITTVDSQPRSSNSGNISAVEFPGDLFGSSGYGIVDSFGVKAGGGEIQSLGFHME